MLRPLVLGVAVMVAGVGPAPACAQRLTGSGPLAAVPVPVSLDTTGRFRAAFHG